LETRAEVLFAAHIKLGVLGGAFRTEEAAFEEHFFQD
jgi:hypothetical protein